MAMYKVTYWYLASGMENGPDIVDYGLVDANTPKGACRIIADRECGDDEHISD